MGIEEALQYQHGSDLVDHFAVPGKGPPGGVQVAVGLRRGEPLVPQVNGERESVAQDFCEGLGLRGLGADVAGHVERIAKNDGRARVFAEQAAERLQVRFDVPANERENRLGGEPQLIGDGNADAAISEIEAKKARRHSRMVARRTGEARGKIGILQ